MFFEIMKYAPVAYLIEQINLSKWNQWFYRQKAMKTEVKGSPSAHYEHALNSAISERIISE